jgi:aspartate carbamoyltransferase regulatory subunit
MQSKELNRENEKLKIKYIKNGVVIDHITAGCALEVLRILGVGEGYGDEVTLAMNIPSKKIGKKDIVKLENKEMKKDEVNKISIIAPNATIARIRDYEVVEKNKVSLPSEITGIIKCSNPQCVSNKCREPVTSAFIIIERDPLTLSCKYCERELKGFKFSEV